MHELALAHGIVDVVLEKAGGARVRRVRVRVGDRQRVVAESLEASFAVATQDTLAAGATLEIEPVSGDELLVDGIELPDGWIVRPGATVAR